MSFLVSIKRHKGGRISLDTHQYAVAVDDGVEAMSNSEHSALLKLVPDGFLDQLIGPEGEGHRVYTHKPPHSNGL